jgi:hypothetical protein
MPRRAMMILNFFPYIFWKPPDVLSEFFMPPLIRYPANYGKIP